MLAQTTSELTKRVATPRNAKEKQFCSWVQDYSDQLFRYSILHVTDQELSKDLVQDTFLSAWKNIEKFRGEASPKNWLFTILKNKITDHYRKVATRQKAQPISNNDHIENPFFDEEDHWKTGLYPQPWSVNFENAAETEEFFQVFKSCGSKLKSIQNSVFVMKYVDGLKSSEICKVLRISSSNYWVLIHRAKLQLRACLEKTWIKK